jgi:hypothetical protein
MILLTPELGAILHANAEAHLAAQAAGQPEPDPAPVVKFFHPVGAATWLATEIEEDGDTLFGLADLGFGCPELGIFSLAELASVKAPLGLGIERDSGFASNVPISQWADLAHHTGSILDAERLLLISDDARRLGGKLPPRR